MKKPIRIIGVPIDLGQSHRGVDMGPSAIRYAGLASSLRKLGYETRDHGDIQVARHYSLPDISLEHRISAISRACSQVYKAGRQAVADGEIPIFLGGDHSTAIGSIGGVTHETRCGVIWVDAHGDFNTPESSPSGNVHGMALATLFGQGAPELVNLGRPGQKVPASDLAIIGIRDLDEQERISLQKAGYSVYTMRAVDELGMKVIMEKVLADFAHLPSIHVSFDLDVMETTEAPGVGTPVPGGLTYRESQLLMEMLSDTGKLLSLDLMEVNPILDIQNKTAQTAVSLTASLFGKTIL